MDRRVTVLPAARRDLAAIRAWLRQPGSGRTPRRSLAAIERAVRDLALNPFRHPHGLIRGDELGLDRLYLQAKRYQPTNKVGVDTIRSFAGALDDHGADKGIMITTSAYSPDAIAYAKRNQRKRIILIDGEALTDLMIRFNVGVRLQQTYELKRIDQDYFDEVEAD
jgi:plasmid stabilization system protein ParE